MKNITRTKNERTVLSVSPDSVELKLGTDLNPDKLEPFLSIIDGILESVEESAKPYYGHFSFSKSRMEVILSKKSNEPNVFDLTYGYPW